MFTQLHMSNFKSLHGEHRFDLRRISVFIGPNRLLKKGFSGKHAGKWHADYDDIHGK